MKIAVFENEYESVRGAFEGANLLEFNNSLIIDLYPSSQSAVFNDLTSYHAIFIDIDLSSNSLLDGFSLIQKIVTSNPAMYSRIIILTGNNRIEEILREKNIYSPSIQIIYKPTHYVMISEAIKSVR